jgi:hypothetical protein
VVFEAAAWHQKVWCEERSIHWFSFPFFCWNLLPSFVLHHLHQSFCLLKLITHSFYHSLLIALLPTFVYVPIIYWFYFTETVLKIDLLMWSYFLTTNQTVLNRRPMGRPLYTHQCTLLY